MRIVGDDSFKVATSDGDVTVLADLWYLVTSGGHEPGTIWDMNRAEVADYGPGFYGFKYGCTEYLVRADTLAECADQLADRLTITEPCACVVHYYNVQTELGSCRLAANGKHEGKWGTGGGMESNPYIIIGNMPSREQCVLAWYEATKAMTEQLKMTVDEAQAIPSDPTDNTADTPGGNQE